MSPFWTVPAGKSTGEIRLSMSGLNTLRIIQEHGSLTVDTGQLRALLDTLFWFDEIYHADLQEALAHLSGCADSTHP